MKRKKANQTKKRNPADDTGRNRTATRKMMKKADIAMLSRIAKAERDIEDLKIAVSRIIKGEFVG